MFIIANPSGAYFLAYTTRKGYHWRKGQKGREVAKRFATQEAAKAIAENYQSIHGLPQIQEVDS